MNAIPTELSARRTRPAINRGSKGKRLQVELLPSREHDGRVIGIVSDSGITLRIGDIGARPGRPGLKR
jgi:hypothetical protein